MNDRFIVFTVDTDQQQLFADFVSAADRDSALEMVLDHRDYCVHGEAFKPDELRQLAHDCVNG